MSRSHRRGPRQPPELSGGGKARTRDAARAPQSADHGDSGADAQGAWAVGYHAVRTALERHPERVEKLILSRALDGGRSRHLMAMAREGRIPCQTVPPEALERIAGRGVQHQGVGARITMTPVVPAEELLERLGSAPLVVVLDGVEDPRNLGAVLRSAAAFGVDAVFVPERRSAPLSAAALRTAAGGADLVPVGRATNLGRLLDALEQAGFTLLALDMTGSQPVWGAAWEGPVALVAGGEEKGIRPTIRSRCTGAVSIPIRPEIGSLNVSVAVGIALAAAIQARGLPTVGG